MQHYLSARSHWKPILSGLHLVTQLKVKCINVCAPVMDSPVAPWLPVGPVTVLALPVEPNDGIKTHIFHTQKPVGPVTLLLAPVGPRYNMSRYVHHTIKKIEPVIDSPVAPVPPTLPVGPRLNKPDIETCLSSYPLVQRPCCRCCLGCQSGLVSIKVCDQGGRISITRNGTRGTHTTRRPCMV